MMLNRSFIKKPTLNLFLETLKDDLKYSLPVSFLSFLLLGGLNLISRFHFLDDIITSLSAAMTFMFFTYGTIHNVVAIFSVFIVIKNFSFLYHAEKYDAYFALPISRSGLFITRFLSSVIASLLPAIAVISGIAIESGTVFIPLGDAQVSLFHAVITVVPLICGSTAVFAVISGKASNAVASYLCFFASLGMIGGLATNIKERFLLGYDFGIGVQDAFYESVTTDLSGIGKVVFYTFELGGGLFSKGSSRSIFEREGEITKRIILATICIVLAWIIFCFRRNDSREKAFCVKGLNFVISVFAGIMGFAFLSSQKQGNRLENLGFLIVGSLSAVLLAILFGILTNRGFKKLWVSAVAGLCSAVIICSCAGLLNVFGENFINNVPRPETVESIKITFEDGSVIESLPSDEIFTLHKKIAENLTDIFKEKTDKTISNMPKEWVTFEYELKNDKRLRRRFWYKKGEFKQEIFDCYASDEYFEYAKKLVDSSYGLTITSANFSLKDYPVVKKYMELLFEMQEKDKKTFLPKIMDKNPNNRIYVTVIMPDGNESEMIFFMGDYTIDMMKKFIGKKYQYVSGSTSIY